MFRLKAAEPLVPCWTQCLMARARPYLWLLAPYLAYLLPLLLGYSWNTIGGVNVLNPPEGYSGRSPAFPITAESWGASVVNLPLEARIRAYIGMGELPLWNPYQGLGQTFLAQGDGNPFFPPAILRAFLPDAGRVLLTLAMMYVSASALYCLLRNLGIDELPAVFGGVALSLSGAFSLHLARPNLADQTALFPILLWATERAVATRTFWRLLLLSFVTFLHTIGGFIQIAFASTLVTVGFAVVLSAITVHGIRPGLTRLATVVIAFALGVGMASFSLLPTLEAMREDFSKNTIPVWSLQPFHATHIVTFFAPAAYGYPFQNLPLVARQTGIPVDWNNLFAFSGALLLYLSLIGMACAQRMTRVHRLLIFFFIGSAILLFGRYLSIPPFNTIDMLPVFSSQTKKHSTQVIAIALILASAISLHYVRAWSWWRVSVALTSGLSGVLLVLVGSLMLLSYDYVADDGRRQRLLWAAYSPFLLSTVAILALAALMIVVARWRAARALPYALAGLILALVAELTFFVPLGRGDPEFVYLRLLATGLLFLGAFLLMLAGRPFGVISASISTATAVVVAVYLITSPGPGLPHHAEASRPPGFLRWLREQADDRYRTFGVFPDFSSLGQVQDVSVVGPFAPPTFYQFVHLVSDESTATQYVQSTEFMLAGRRDFDLDGYRERQPLFDWLGVRYLVLDRTFFSPERRMDHESLMRAGSKFAVAYEDDRVTIVESMAARPKVEFTRTVQPMPNDSAVLAALRRTPSRIEDIPMVEAADGPWTLPQTVDAAVDAEVDILEYRPGLVRIALQSDGPGLLVLKDAYATGWTAHVNGVPTPIVRVNGIVRGVKVSDPGCHHIVFEYRPPSFSIGVAAAGVSLLGAIVLLFLLGRTRSGVLHAAALTAGIVLAVCIAGGALVAFLATSRGRAGEPQLPPGIAVSAVDPGGLPVTVRPLATINDYEIASPGAVTVDPGTYVLASDGRLLLGTIEGRFVPVSAPPSSQIATYSPTGQQSTASFDGTRWQSAAGAPPPMTPPVPTALTMRTNLALGRPAQQSSVVSLGGAWYAVDGHLSGGRRSQTTAITQRERQPWWEVDLGSVQRIASIEVGVPPGPPVEHPAYLLVSREPFPKDADLVSAAMRQGVITRQLTTLKEDRPPVVEAIQAEGRYVRVQLGGTGTLRLAEVRVWSSPLAAPELPNSEYAWQNVAVQGQARQSSVERGSPEQALDDDLTGNSLSLTRNELDAWWEVDLGRSVSLKAVKLWLRTECCHQDRDLHIIASETPFHSTILSAAGQPGATSVSVSGAVSMADPLSVPLEVAARYIRVQQHGSGNLGLGEVQAWAAVPFTESLPAPSLENLAVQRAVRQSSTSGGLLPERAVDGDTNGDAARSSVSQTGPDPTPWWEVDLGESRQIERIDLFNRTDCCQERLREFYVMVSHDPFPDGEPARLLRTPGLTAYYVHGPAGERVGLPISASGRYVRIQLARPDYLALAEVQIWGASQPRPATSPSPP
jgi:hypothetical protein